MAILHVAFIALCFFIDTCFFNALRFFSDLFPYLKLAYMIIESLLSKPVWQMTGEELLFLSRHSADTNAHKEPIKVTPNEKHYVYGISGICETFRCSRATAIRIKKSGVIDKAITHIGWKIVIDADLALQLASAKAQPYKLTRESVSIRMKDGSSYHSSISAKQAAWYNGVKPEDKEDVALKIAATMFQEQILVTYLNGDTDFDPASRIKSVSSVKQRDGRYLYRITLTDGYTMPLILMTADENDRYRRLTPDNQQDFLRMGSRQTQSL